MTGKESEVSAVRAALYRGDRTGARELVSGGASLNVFDLAALGDVEGLERALAADRDAVGALSADGFTALHFAAYLGGAGAVSRLLDAGAAVNAVAANDMRVQPLHSAAALGDVEACRLLIAAGADTDARQARDHTPLHESRTHRQRAARGAPARIGSRPDGTQRRRPRRRGVRRRQRARGDRRAPAIDRHAITAF